MTNTTLKACSNREGCDDSPVYLLKNSPPLPPSKLSDYVSYDDLTYPATLYDYYDRDTARYCADLITRVYAFKLGRLKSPVNAKAMYALYAQDGWIVGVIFYDRTNNRAWVAFRGSMTTKDWQVNFEYDQLQVSDLKCHTGFVNAYQSFKGQLRGYLTLLWKVGRKSNKPFTVVLTGHSSGASLATISLIDLKERGLYDEGQIDKMYVYLFSSPKTCNADVGKLTNTPVFHIYQENDYVPLIPPSTVIFESNDLDERLFKYENTGRDVKLRSSVPFPLNHSMPSIVKHL